MPEEQISSSHSSDTVMSRKESEIEKKGPVRNPKDKCPQKDKTAGSTNGFSLELCPFLSSLQSPNAQT